jgi:hypothetical protein
MVETKILTWSYDSIDLIGGQIKDYIESKCIDGWYCHQIQPTHQEEYSRGCLRLRAAVIILMRNKTNMLSEK